MGRQDISFYLTVQLRGSFGSNYPSLSFLRELDIERKKFAHQNRSGRSGIFGCCASLSLAKYPKYGLH